MFKKPAESESPLAGRTAFWSDDEASKLKVNTATEGTFWDTPARQSGLARGEKFQPESPAINPPAEKSRTRVIS